MQVSVSAEVNELIDSAAASSMRTGVSFVGVEHLFTTIIAKPNSLPAEFVTTHNKALNSVVTEIGRKPWPGKLPGETMEAFYTPRCGDAINEAARLAKQLSGGHTQGGHLLLAILADPYSSPARVIDAAGHDREAIINDLHDLLRHQSGAPAPAAAPTVDTAAKEVSERVNLHAPGTEPSPLADHQADDDMKKFTRDLSAMAREGKLDEAIGRNEEMQDLIEILARKGKSNAILVGDAGVGKTQVVEGLAIAMANGEFGESYAQKNIIELNMGALMSGTAYRGAFEEKLNGLIETLKVDPNAILFIDEIHLMMGAGSTEGGGVDMANLLKPALARGEMKCIGATTLAEYRQHIAKDPAMERRFQMVRLEPLSPQDAYAVLKKIRPSLQRHHGVRISKRALRASIALTIRYMPNRHLPDKAIDVLDQTCARHRLMRMAVERGTDLSDTTIGADGIADRVGPHEVRKVVARATGIPLEEITSEERRRLSDLERQLSSAIIGQDEAVKRVASTIKRSRAGLADPNRPDGVLLFLGPSGVGKSQLAKALASIVFGSSRHLKIFDMSEYNEAASVTRLVGASAGYVGHEEDGQLTKAITEQPFSILLFDEIEKAHTNIYDIFLPMLDEGRVTDAKGRELSFKNNLIIFTSNVGADIVGEGANADNRRAIIEKLHEHFRPEFINRIDEVVPFCHLLPEDIRKILSLNLREVQKRLRSKGVKLHVYQGAYEHIAEQGYSYEFGARELRRSIEKLIVNPISSAIIDGKFAQGDTVAVKEENGTLLFEKHVPAEGVAT